MLRFPVAAVVVAVAGCSCPRARPAPEVAGPAKEAVVVQRLDETATAVRLQATIYEIRIPADNIAALDAARLAATDFAKYPPELGQSRPLYLVDQQVTLAGDRVMVGTEEPVVTNTRVTDTGQTINQMEYRDVGAIVEFKAQRTGPRLLEVTSTIEMSALTDSPVEVPGSAATPVTRKSIMSLKGPVELGKPTVLISGDASSRDKDGRAVVYVARLVLGGGSSGGN